LKEKQIKVYFENVPEKTLKSKRREERKKKKTFANAKLDIF
jgi:hypothetical protein